MSMEVGHAVPSVRGEATAGGHAARHTLLHTRTAHTTCTACNAGRLTAAGDQGPTTLCANSEEGADSPHSSDATELGPIGGELRVRNREPPAPSYTLRCARLHRTPCLHREPPAPSHRTLRPCAAVTYKTELCARWKRGLCTYGEDCQFAHGDQELQARCRPAKCAAPVRSPNACHASRARPHRASARRRYKTIVCQNFASGKCPYGRRCNCQAIAACDDLSHLQLQNVAGATSSTSCRRRPSAPLQRAFQALSSCSTLSCSALSSSDQRRPRPRSFSTRTSTRRCRPSSRRSVEPRRRCRRAPCRRCRR